MYQPANTKVVEANRRANDFSIPLATSILVIFCCPVLGIVALVFTVMGMAQHRGGNPGGGQRMKKMANYANLAGLLVGVMVLAAILIVAFCHDGARIYFPAPTDRNKIFWQSNS